MALGRLLRPPGLVAAAAVQVVGLAAWLGLVRAHPASSPEGLLGVGALVSGLFLGVLLTDACAGERRRRLPLARALALAVTEAVLWVGWLATARLVGGPVGILAASVALAVVLVPHRSTEAASLHGNAGRAGRFDPAGIPAGFVAGAGAATWLAFVGYGPVLVDALGARGALRAGLAGVAATQGAAGLFEPHGVFGLLALAATTLVGRFLVARRPGP